MIRRKLVLCLLCVAVVGMLAPSAFAAETITITDFYTALPQVDSEGDYIPADTFDVWDPVMLVCDYTVANDGDDLDNTKLYKVIVKFRAFGQKIRIGERHRPGEYTTTISLPIPTRAAGSTKTPKVKVKLRQRGVPGPDGLLDFDSSTTAPVTINALPGL